jgi:hypothetical protein
MQTITSQQSHIGQPDSCLECKKTLVVSPGFAVEVTKADGAVEGYLHPAGDCRAKWEAQHPGFNYGHPK